ncbi:MAG: hypothetical protein WBE26_18670 [Phycisphaerae bacterium]
MRGFNVRSVVTAATPLLILLAGCGSGISIVIRPQPSECFRQDVVDVGCRTRQSVVSVCEEDFFGFVYCYDDYVIDVVCDEIVVDSYLICD